MAREPEHGFVGRGGMKLAHALDAFGIDVRGMMCADLGCNVGGFTDCLLQRGAARVVAVDTGYGALAYRLRVDARVEVRERTNALHAAPVEGGVDLVVIDLGWTPQRLAIPAAMRWLREGGRIVTLIKPHYERSAREGGRMPRGAVLGDEEAERIARETVEGFGQIGAEALGLVRSPIRGGGKKGEGNAEWLALARRRSA